jgi:hypothetical protein
MVHNTWNYCVLGLCTSSGILGKWKLDLFPSPGEVGKTPALFGFLERAKLSHFTVTEVCSLYGKQLSRCVRPSPEDGKRSSFRNVMFSSF